MEPAETSPFMDEFLKQVDVLSAAFRNLPADDYEAALEHLQNLLDSLSNSSKLGLYQAGSSAHQTIQYADGNLDQNEINVCHNCSQVFTDTTEFAAHRCENATEDTKHVCNYSSEEKADIGGISADESPTSRRSRRKRSDPRRSIEVYSSDNDEDIPSSNRAKIGRRVKKKPKADQVGCSVVTDFKGDERFQCDQCELKFSYYAALLRHLDARHKTFDANQKIQEINKKAVSCDQCGATLSSKGALHAHMQMHAGVQPHNCDVCHKKFSLKSNLLRHKRIHQGLKPYQCDICEKRFTEKRSVEVHRRIHTGERPYSCDVCGMKFSQLGSWMGHRDTHKGKDDSKYECDICDKKFTQKIGLTNHRKRHHDNQRTHKCNFPECEMAFYTAEELRAHTVIHTGEKPYLCAECGKSFTRQQAFKNHMKLHDRAGMEYRCDVCSETFTSSWTLARHRKSEHRDLPLEEEQAGISVEGVVSLDEFTAEELSVLPKEVLAVYCTEGSSGSQEILDAISKVQMF